MQQLRRHGDTQDEAQRWQAQQAARPQTTPEARAQDLAQRMIAAIKDGRNEDARGLALELKPFLSLLPEGN